MRSSYPSPTHSWIIIIQQEKYESFNLKIITFIFVDNFIPISLSHCISDISIEVESIIEFNSEIVNKIGIKIQFTETNQ